MDLRSYNGLSTDVDGQCKLTGHLADKPISCQSSRGLDSSRNSQLTDSELLKIYTLVVH